LRVLPPRSRIALAAPRRWLHARLPPTGSASRRSPSRRVMSVRRQAGTGTVDEWGPMLSYELVRGGHSGVGDSLAVCARSRPGGGAGRSGTNIAAASPTTPRPDGSLSASGSPDDVADVLSEVRRLHRQDAVAAG